MGMSNIPSLNLAQAIQTQPPSRSCAAKYLFSEAQSFVAAAATITAAETCHLFEEVSHSPQRFPLSDGPTFFNFNLLICVGTRRRVQKSNCRGRQCVFVLLCCVFVFFPRVESVFVVCDRGRRHCQQLQR